MAVKFSALLLVGLLAASQVFAQSGQNGGSSGPSGAGGGGGGGTGANPTATAGPTAVNGSATTFLRSDGAPAVQIGTAAQKGIVQADGTTISVSAGVISSVNNGTVTSVATTCGISGGTITNTGTISSNSNPNVQAGANYAFQSTDCGSIVYLNNASNQIPTIAQAGSAGFLKGYYVEACNIGAGTQTVTPATSTIGGSSTFVIPAGTAAAPKCVGINSDGTNYVLDLTGAASGGTANTIASGTATLGTSVIASASCATVVTVTATGTLTTDAPSASFNGDPTAVTGYIPSTSGMLTIFAYPTAGNVNFKVCNATSSSITPGAITLNWRVVR